MNEYIREWQINLPEINIVHTKGREAAIVKVTGVMPMKTSWHLDYFLIIFKYNLIANDDFIEIIGKKDYTYSSTYDLDIDDKGRFTYYFKLKNVDNLPAGTTKTIKLTHQIIADRPFGEDTDNDFESTIIFSQVVNVNITIKEGNEISTQPIIPNPTVPTVAPTVTNDPTNPLAPMNPPKPAPELSTPVMPAPKPNPKMPTVAPTVTNDPTNPLAPMNPPKPAPEPSTPVMPAPSLNPKMPTVTVTPTDTTTPTIAPEATDTNSMLLYAGLFVAALVLIKK